MFITRVYMNRTVRIFIAIALVPTFVFMVSAMCFCKPVQAAVSKDGGSVLTAAPHSCCPDSNHCKNKSTLINKDEGVQASSFQVKHSDLNVAVTSVAFNVERVTSQDFFSQTPFIKTDPIQLSTIQLLI